MSDAWSDVRWITTLLVLSGIQLPPRGPLLPALLGSLLFVLSLAFVASEVAFCGVTGFVGSSVVLCMGSTLLLTFLLWAALLKGRKGICRYYTVYLFKWHLPSVRHYS